MLSSVRNQPSPPDAEGLRARTISGSEIDQYRAGWEQLAQRRANAFLTPQWYETWLRHYGGAAEAALTVVCDPAGELVGLMPLTRAGRELRFAGAGLGDCFHPLAAAANEHTVAAAVGADLQRRDYLVLDHVAESATWPDALQRAAPRTMARSESRQDVLPVIDLTDLDWDQFLGARSRNFRSQVRRRLRAAEAEGGHFRRTTDPITLDADWEHFLRLQDARWEPRGGSTLSTERSRDFHRDFARALLERGWLRLWFLEIDGEPVATWYGWSLGDRYAYYLGGFDPAWEKLAPGFVLLSHTIRSALEEGVHEYDLLRGGEAYKSRFATGSRRVMTIVCAPAWSRERALAASEAAAWRASRRMPGKVRSAGQRVYHAMRSVMPTGKLR